jgi:hypothetical protein
MLTPSGRIDEPPLFSVLRAQIQSIRRVAEGSADLDGHDLSVKILPTHLADWCGTAITPLRALPEVGDPDSRADQVEVWDSQARNSRDKSVSPERSRDFPAKHCHASVDELNFLIQCHLLHDQIGPLVG